MTLPEKCALFNTGINILGLAAVLLIALRLWGCV